MLFELKPYNRNVSSSELIADLKSVASVLQRATISRAEYDKLGKFSAATLRKRFGGWLNALQQAGLPPTRDYFTTDEQLLDELKRVADLPGVGVLSKETFNKHKKISNITKIAHRFGSWSQALKTAGLTLASSQIRYSTNDLFENLLNVWTHYGRQPSSVEIGIAPSVISRHTYAGHFGTWRKALEAFVARMNRGEKESAKEEKLADPNQRLLTPERGELKSEISLSEKRGIGLSLRYKVFSRDKFKCVGCGTSPATNQSCVLHVDHILPFSKGGKTTIENLQTLCGSCNLGKGNRHSEKLNVGVAPGGNQQRPKIDLVGNIMVSGGSRGNWINFELINMGSVPAVDIKYYFSYDEPEQKSELNVACSRLSPNEKSSQLEFHYKNTDIFTREVQNLKMNFVYKDSDGRTYHSGRNIKQAKRADGNYNINGYIEDYFNL